MFEQGKTGGLIRSEKKIVKYLLSQDWNNQDILALINSERAATVNPGRIADVKKDDNQPLCTAKDFESYQQFKRSFDLKTGLNPFLDERLIKSREAMKLAVSVFNNPVLHFRAETFAVLANIAWTYLALEYSHRHGLPTERANGKAISLADFLNTADCPFSDDLKLNLRALIKIRDATEHTVLGPYDSEWIGIFQASCMNYERELTKEFGARVSLANEISFALQFSGLSIGQVNQMANSELPEEIKSLNAEIFAGLTEEQKNSLEFQFSVVYMTVASSKSKAAFQFVSPESAEGKEIANVLVKHKPSAHTHPFRPTDVIDRVRENTGLNFTQHIHTQKWKSHNVRPASGAEKPASTNLDYCFYNPTFKSYTYNQAWVDLICSELIEQQPG